MPGKGKKGEESTGALSEARREKYTGTELTDTNPAVVGF